MIPARSIPAALAALALAATACGGEGATEADAGAPSDGPLVVATTTILGDLVGELVGDAATVETLMAPGQDPHGYAPSAKQAQRLREADLVVAFGLGLEEAAADVIEAAEGEGVPVVHVAEEVDPLGVDEEHADDEHSDEDEHDHDSGDPHVWFDPLRMADGMAAVAAALEDVAPGTDWEARADELGSDLEALDGDVREILDVVPEGCRVLVTNHDNLRYLAERYDLEVVGTVLPGTSTAAEPSAQDFAELAGLLDEAGVPAIFAETTQTTRLADSLAAESGREVAVVELYTDALGEPGSGAETYATMLTTDARRIADALADCG